MRRALHEATKRAPMKPAAPVTRSGRVWLIQALLGPTSAALERRELRVEALGVGVALALVGHQPAGDRVLELGRHRSLRRARLHARRLLLELGLEHLEEAL